MNFFASYQGLPPSIYTLFCIQVINRLGEFVMPFLTLLLTQKFGFSFAETGIIVMTASLSTAIATFLGGKFADRIGRKKTYLLGQTLTACFMFICGFITMPLIVCIFLILSSFFNGLIRPSISAIMIDLLPPDKRQAGMSLNYLGINVGVAIGPLAAGFLFNNFLPLLFIGDALTSFLAIAVFYRFIKETKPIAGAIKNTSLEKAETGSTLQVLLKRPKLVVFLIIFMLYSFIYTQCKFSLPMILNEVFIDKGAEVSGFLMSINALTVILLSLLIISITKRYQSLTNMILAGIFYAVGFGMIGQLHFLGQFVFSTVLWTIGEILSATNSGVFIANNSPENFRARFSALGQLAATLGEALGTSAMGVYINFTGLRAVWPLIFILACLAASCMFILKSYSFTNRFMFKKFTPKNYS